MREDAITENSPSLSGLIKRNFPQNEINVIATAYRLACQNNACEEKYFERAQGISFNPRPARITQIFFENSPERPGYTDVSLCILTCATISAATFEQIEEKDLLRELVDDSAKLRFKIENFESIPEGNEKSIAFAHYIDLMRHLHMAELNIEEVELFLKKVIDFLHYQLDSNPEIAGSKLYKILETSAKRQKQNLL